LRAGKGKAASSRRTSSSSNCPARTMRVGAISTPSSSMERLPGGIDPGVVRRRRPRDVHGTP